VVILAAVVVENRVAELERKIGQQSLEIDFLKARLAANRGGADAAGAKRNRAISDQIDQEAGRDLLRDRPVSHLLAGVERSRTSVHGTTFRLTSRSATLCRSPMLHVVGALLLGVICAVLFSCYQAIARAGTVP